MQFMKIRTKVQKINTKVHASWSIVAFDIGVIAGDVVASVLEPTFFAPMIFLGLAILALVLAIIMSNVPALILAFLAGVILILQRTAPDFISKSYYQELIGKEVTISGVVAKDPEESSGKWNLNLKEIKLRGGSASANSVGVGSVDAGADGTNSDADANEMAIGGQIFAQVSNVEAQRSDRIILSGTLSEGFGSYSASMFRPEVVNVERPEPGDVFLKMRDFFAKGISDYLPKKEASLGLGYLLGQKSGVDKEFQENLRTVGLTHIIVASGAHLGVLVSIARKIFGKLSRFASLLSGVIFMLIFIGITGVSASMLRAGLVTGLSLVCWYFGRKIQPMRLILLVAAITLIVNPMYLTDLAWLLSFASFTGILVVAPIMTKVFYDKDKTPGPIASTLISSVAAALLCTPILLYFFGTVSLISVVANILILPTVSIAMGMTFLTGASALCLPFVAGVVGKLTTLLLDYQISVVEFFGDKKMFLMEVAPENALIFLSYVPVGVVIFTTFMIQRRREKRARKVPNSILPMLAE